MNPSRKECSIRMRPILFAGALVSLVLAGPAAALEVGQKAPDFTLAGVGGKQIKLADMLGKGPIVIYTFIQAFTGP
jgi:peroxiredoxin Q/BCP